MSDCLLDSQWKGCCCECEYQHHLFKHPWNKNEFTNGSITDQMGFVCLVPFSRGAIFSDREHGFCEEYKQRNKDEVRNI